MKGNIMKQLLALICGAILIAAYAQAQTSTTSSTTASSPTTTSMTSDNSTAGSTTDSSGTVTDYTPGAAITLDPGTGRPVHFIIGKKVQVLGPDGKVLADTDLKQNSKVQLHLVQEGDRTVVDKINVEDLK
jgi:ABC-type transport system substrate-binding protein